MKPTPIVNLLHSGNTGDIVYSLPVAASFGKANYYLRVSTLLPQNLLNALLPLLQQQPYLNIVKQWEGERIDLDMDEFRIKNDLINGHLSVVQLACYQRWYDISKPWLFNIQATPIKEIVINRTLRYYGSFNYRKVVAKYWKRIIFIGLEEEYKKFCCDFGTVEWYPTNNFLEVAQVIQGAKLFIGNQSCPYAIAESLKQNRILESSIDVPNCQPLGGRGYSSFEDIDFERTIEELLQ